MFDKSNMRFHDPLDDVLRGVASTRVLRQLIRSQREGQTSRELAAGAKVSLSQAIQTLDRLEQVGLVSSRTIGRAVEWRVVKEHVLTRLVEDLFTREAEVLSSLKKTVADWAGAHDIQSVALFGSIARGTETLASDVDLHVVAASPAGREEIDAGAGDLTVRVAREYGNPLSLLIHDPGAVRRLRGNPLMVALRAEERPIRVVPNV